MPRKTVYINEKDKAVWSKSRRMLPFYQGMGCIRPVNVSIGFLTESLRKALIEILTQSGRSRSGFWIALPIASMRYDATADVRPHVISEWVELLDDTAELKQMLADPIGDHTGT